MSTEFMRKYPRSRSCRHCGKWFTNKGVQQHERRYPMTQRKPGAKVKAVSRCEVCNRASSMTNCNRFGEKEPMSRLGSLTKCGHCLRLACPDCLMEGECCELAHDEDTGAVTGWAFTNSHNDEVASSTHIGIKNLAGSRTIHPVTIVPGHIGTDFKITPITKRRAKK